MTLEVSTTLNTGDPAGPGIHPAKRDFASVTIGTVTVTVYESTMQPGLAIVDIDTATDDDQLAVTINDYYVLDNSGTKTNGDFTTPPKIGE